MKLAHFCLAILAVAIAALAGFAVLTAVGLWGLKIYS